MLIGIGRGKTVLKGPFVPSRLTLPLGPGEEFVI